MKAKTLLQVLSLSTNLYVILKDEELMKTLSSLAEKGKEKLDEILHDEEDEEAGSTERIIARLLVKAREAKADLEERIAKGAEAAYAKMHIAHTKETEQLRDQITLLELKLQVAEKRLSALEQFNTIS